MEVIEPLNRKAEVQRYMDFSKFIHLLESQQLFLSRVSSFEDKLEGGLTPYYYLIKSGMAEALDHAINSILPSVTPQTESEIKQKEQDTKRFQEKAKKRKVVTVFGDIPAIDIDFPTLYKQHKEWVDVSCWHSNESESMAMRKVYGGETNSICIVSDISRIINSVSPPRNKKLALSKVSYINHENEQFLMDHPLAPLLHKSKFYSFENEVRLVAYDPEATLMEERDIHDNGTLIDVDLSRLISEVRVAKDAPNWFFELVSTLVKDKYELDVDVKKSKMNQEPVFGISTLE